ncbi:MAG: 4Fe-4S cluster-binding domain-containing protein [Proteobacteria bacterium]|nr:4Fe-4S cluster-binding domain-containing protein [Pseudomonadota bacterium]
MKSRSIYPALQITDACNKKCRACLRMPISNKHRLKYDKYKMYLRDLVRVSKTHKIEYQFITGGEPTIWKDRNRDITDILASLDELKLVKTVTMPTNGKLFENRDTARDLLKRISERIDSYIMVGISVAKYQENFNENGCEALENIVSVCEDPQVKIMPLALVTLSTDDDTSERLYAQYPYVFQRVTALAPLGGGSDMSEECPSISLSGNDKSSAGAFLPHFRGDVTKKLKITDDEFNQMPNAEIMNRLSLYCNCGKSPFITDKWHYCLPFKGNSKYDLCRIGEMREDTISDFIAERPWLESIRERGVLAAVEEYKGSLSAEVSNKVDQMLSNSTRVSVAYRGCMVCKEFADIGVWEEIESRLEGKRRYIPVRQ